MKNRFGLFLAVAVVALAIPSFAAITPSNTCAAFLPTVTGAGIAVTDCTGFYSGNRNNNADFPDVKALLLTEFPGVTIGSAIIEQKNTASGTNFNFAAPVFGDTVVGVHWGGKGGGDTAFYRVTISAGFTDFDFPTVSPLCDQGCGISNVALYRTQQRQVAEPAVLALLGMGLAGTALLNRRRKQTT